MLNNNTNFEFIDNSELDIDLELLSEWKKWYIELINNPYLNKIIDETKSAKESILD